MLNKTALITGASASIGKGFATKFVQEGRTLVVTARRKPQLEELAQQLREQYDIKVTIINESQLKT